MMEYQNKNIHEFLKGNYFESWKFGYKERHNKRSAKYKIGIFSTSFFLPNVYAIFWCEIHIISFFDTIEF